MSAAKDTLQRLRDRDQELAEHRKKLPTFAVVEPARMVAKAPARVQISEEVRNRADDLMAAEAAAKHVEQWRANLRKYAPLAKWEDAWRAQPDIPATLGKDARGEDIPNPDYFGGTDGVFRWLESGCQKHLVLIGAIGCGKSVAAAVAVRKWVEPGKGFQPVCWMSADELVSAMFHPYADDSPKLCRYNVIDDMGDERKADFEEALAKLLEQQDRKIIITTNLAMKHKDPAKTFRGRYPRGRLTDRMRDTCTKVIVPGGSRRDQSGGF
jgi:hypothetical protein